MIEGLRAIAAACAIVGAAVMGGMLYLGYYLGAGRAGRSGWRPISGLRRHRRNRRIGGAA